jgi:site-specific DNA-methyltransferase (adenine-specific)
MEYKLVLGDCLEKLKDIADNSIDSIVTDPPYHLTSIVKRFGKEGSAPAKHGKDGSFGRLSKGFMGQEWDGGDIAFREEVWKECLRVLKPGGHLIAFSGSRTYHRMAYAIDESGFEIRDQIMWVYGSGFPKSHNIGKSIDKKLCNEREVVGEYKQTIPNITPRKNDGERFSHGDGLVTKGTSEWEGWGTALKPAHEPIVLARKPFKGSVADNVLEYGTGALNIEACRVGDEEITVNGKGNLWLENLPFEERKGKDVLGVNQTNIGRYPANFLHDGLEEEWSKYFYCPKASKNDRNEGCEDLEEKPAGCMVGNNELARPNHKGLNDGKFVTAKNNHPTVKPTELMRYLVRLVTPKNGTVLDPFMGSGSTGKACMLEGFDFIGIELSEEYLQIAEKRINNVIKKD